MPGMQGLIITLAIVFLIGIIIGFYLRQARINELTEGLKRSQKRQEELEIEHQQRLQAATEQLQRDYETQLAERIEAYQAQHEAHSEQLEAEYQARYGALVPAVTAEEAQAHREANLAVEQQLRRQYETRLREAAVKLQRAYDDHLRQKLAAARQAYDLDYEKRLTVALERHHDDLLERSQALDSDVANRLQMMQGGSAVPTPSGPDPSQIARWRQEIEAEVRSDYETRLAEKIEQYQEELSRRTEDLQQEMESRLLFLTQARPDPSGLPGEDTPLNLEDLINAAIDNAVAEITPDVANRLQMMQGGSVVPTPSGPDPSQSDPLDTLLGEGTPGDDALLSSLESLQDLNP